MTFTEPVSFAEALRILREKQIFPTDLSSAELRQIEVALRDRSLFSARTIKAEYLQEVSNVLRDLLDGKTNKATARLALKRVLASMSYTPQEGFGQSEAPPAEPGSLRDISSTRRINLLLETNMRQMANEAFKSAASTPFRMFAFPCFELVRIYVRRVPRGMKELKEGLIEDPGQDWPSRWQDAGGVFFGDGRMIAPKDAEIWSVLGDSAVFADALDTSVPPFAFNSGYGWVEIRRDEAVALGVIGRAEEIQASAPDEARREKARTAMTKNLSPEFLASLKKDLGVARENLTAAIDARRPAGVPDELLAPEFRYQRRAR